MTGSATSKRMHMKRWLTTLGPLLGLLLVWCVFALLIGPRFMRWSNQSSMLQQTTIPGIAALGATLIIISGGIDLSVGSVLALGTMVMAHAVNSGLPPVLCALAGILTGVLCGAVIGSAVNGFVGQLAALAAGVVVYHSISDVASWPLALLGGLSVFSLGLLLALKAVGRIPLAPFIVTLAMWGAVRGLAEGMGDSHSIKPDITSWLNELTYPQESGLLAFMPGGVWIFLTIALIMGFTLRYTRFGRHVFAIGSNENTARLCGVNIDRTKMWIYVIGSGCAGLASLLLYSKLGGMGSPTEGVGLELTVIASVVIGGASLSGGEGSILGTLAGALTITIINNGCVKLEMDPWHQKIITGAIIVAAVAIDRWRHRRET